MNVNSYQGSQRKREDIADELKALVQKSVREQMVADVSVGTFLSGGVDSSIITYESMQINPQTETFSMGFDERRFDESKYAIQLAEKFNICSNVKRFHKDILNNNYQMLKKWYDEPFGDSSAFPTYFIAEFAKEKVTVVLTGDGGDEVFGGYPRYEMIQEGLFNISRPKYFETQINRAIDKVGFTRKRMYERIRKTYAREMGDRDTVWRKKLGISKDYDKYWVMRRYYHVDLPPITRGQYLDIKTYLPGDILTKVDRAAMAVSLETRVPFLDRKIVEFAFSLSEEDRCQGGRLKGLLKSAYEQELGKGFLNRRKQGFSIPVRYFDSRSTQQEEILRKAWGIN